MLIDPNTGNIETTVFETVSDDLYHESIPFVADPAVPSITRNVIVDDLVVGTEPLHDIEYFAGRYHFISNVLFEDNAYREEFDDSITELPLPAPHAFTRMYHIQRIGDRLYVGTNDGFFQISNVSN